MICVLDDHRVQQVGSIWRDQSTFIKWLSDSWFDVFDDMHNINI